MEYIPFTGELDPPDSGFVPFTGKLDGEKPRSAIGEIANQLKAGTIVDLPQMVGQAAQYISSPGHTIYDTGKSIADAATERAKRPDLQADPDSHNFVTNALASGARMLPQYLAPAAAVGAGIAALPFEVPGAIALAGSAALGSVPAAFSQGQQTLDKAREKGIPDEIAIPAARKTAAIEGLGETVGTIAGGHLLGIGGKAIGKTVARAVGKDAGSAASHVLEDATSGSIVKPWLHTIPEAVIGETGTEMAQNAGEAAVEQQAGIDNQSPWEAAKDAVAPTLGMTALLAPFGLAGHAINAHSNQVRAQTLASGQADPVQRATIGAQIQGELQKVDPVAAANFGLHVKNAINGRADLPIGEHLFAAPETVTAPDGTQIDPSAGPLSKAGALAVAQAPLINDDTTPVSGPFVDRPAQPIGQAQEQLGTPPTRAQLTAPQQQKTPLLPGPRRTGEVIVDSQGVARPGTTADIVSRGMPGSTIAVDKQGNAVRQTRQQEQVAAVQRQEQIDTGLTPDVRAAQAKYLLPFKTEEAATKIAASLSKSRGDQYEVIPHPTQSGKFAVVPHETTASPEGSNGVGRTNAVGGAGAQPVLRSTGNQGGSNAAAPVATGRKAISTGYTDASNAALTKPEAVWTGQYKKGIGQQAVQANLTRMRRERPDLEWTVAESNGLEQPYVLEGRSVSKSTNSETQPALSVTSEIQATPEDNPFVSDPNDRLQHPEIRAEVEKMAQNAGWAQVGGKIVRASSEDGMGEVTGRTPWIPKEAWWQGRPDSLNEDKTREAVRKALAGEKLNAKEQRTVDYMTSVAQQSIASRMFTPTEEELQGLGSTDALAVSMVARAAELDENAVEDLARIHANDDAAFMRGIQQILDDHDQDTKTDGGGKESPPKAQAETVTNAPPSEGQVVSGADEFVKAPDGGVDFGEITQEQAAAMKRQAGKIRLERGDENYGEKHIDLRHGDDIRALGFKSVSDFVADIARHIDQIWKPDATSQLVAIHQVGNDRVMFVELRPARDADGDYYTVRSAFPARQGFVKNKKWNLLWEGRAQPSTNSGSLAPFAEPSPRKSGETATIPSGQSSDASISQSSSDGNDFALTAETPDQVRARATAAEQAQKAAEAKKKADEAKAKKEREDKEVADRQDASAENFQLGQAAEESLSGQRDIFDVDQAAHEAATSPKNDLPAPTEAQIDAGNYKHGHVRIAGLDISIENPAGSKRRPEWPTLKSHYGYLRGTIGKDKDHIDVFVKPGTPTDYSGPVFVIDQNKANGHFDEHKVMLGWPDQAAAEAGYKANYTKDWDGIRAITEFSMPVFKQWVAEGDHTLPAKLVAKNEQSTSEPSPSFLKKFMVETDAYDPDADRYVKQQVSAKEALASINDDITTIKALLKCLRG